jgi:lysophospholipase L1-like esterase
MSQATRGERVHGPEPQRGGARPAAAYVGFVFALCAVLAPQALESSTTGWVLAACFALCALVGAAWAAARERAQRTNGPLLALATLHALLVAPELGLRSAGFVHISGIQFGYPHPEDFWRLELDDELFWKLPSSEPMANSLGFFGPEPARPKPAGVRRFVMLGDSCSQQHHPFAWPELAARELATQLGAPVECVNLAMSGYTTLQGRRVAQRWLRELEPDLVALYYGWNDHWLARGAPDAQKGPALVFERLYRASALLQGVRKLAVGAGLLQGEARLLADTNRVPLEEYEANLVALVTLARECGAKVVLVSAPSLHDVRVPEYLLKHHFQRDAQAVVAEHARYNAALREVAQRQETALLDLERDFAARPERATLFLEDGIHFTEAGRAAVAQAFSALVNERGLLR